MRITCSYRCITSLHDSQLQQVQNRTNSKSLEPSSHLLQVSPSRLVFCCTACLIAPHYSCCAPVSVIDSFLLCCSSSVHVLSWKLEHQKLVGPKPDQLDCLLWPWWLMPIAWTVAHGVTHNQTLFEVQVDSVSCCMSPVDWVIEKMANCCSENWLLREPNWLLKWQIQLQSV